MLTLILYSIVKEQIFYELLHANCYLLLAYLYSGDNRDRTGNLRLAKAALSQLSYIPVKSIYVTFIPLIELP